MRAFPTSRKLRIKIKIYKEAMDTPAIVVPTHLVDYSPLQLPGYNHTNSCLISVISIFLLHGWSLGEYKLLCSLMGCLLCSRDPVQTL